MKTLQLLIHVSLILLIAGCMTTSTSKKHDIDATNINECVFTYDSNGMQQTFTTYAEECPDVDGWRDNGPVSGSVAPASASSSVLMSTPSAMSTLHKCVYTFYIGTTKHTYTTCALQCPIHPDWHDAGIPCP